jgi:hypothetical protein
VRDNSSGTVDCLVVNSFKKHIHVGLEPFSDRRGTFANTTQPKAEVR